MSFLINKKIRSLSTLPNVDLATTLYAKYGITFLRRVSKREICNFARSWLPCHAQLTSVELGPYSRKSLVWNCVQERRWNLFAQKKNLILAHLHIRPFPARPCPRLLLTGWPMPLYGNAHTRGRNPKVDWHTNSGWFLEKLARDLGLALVLDGFCWLEWSEEISWSYARVLFEVALGERLYEVDFFIRTSSTSISRVSIGRSRFNKPYCLLFADGSS